MVYSTRRFVLCLTLCYFVLVFLCFSLLLTLRLPRLEKRELILVLFVRLFDLCLFGFIGFLFLLVWTFLLPFSILTSCPYKACLISRWLRNNSVPSTKRQLRLFYCICSQKQWGTYSYMRQHTFKTVCASAVWSSIFHLACPSLGLAVSG